MPIAPKTIISKSHNDTSFETNQPNDALNVKAKNVPAGRTFFSVTVDR